jgi:hypothetical protein
MKSGKQRRKPPFRKDKRRKHRHWRVTVSYVDGETISPSRRPSSKQPLSRQARRPQPGLDVTLDLESLSPCGKRRIPSFRESPFHRLGLFHGCPGSGWVETTLVHLRNLFGARPEGTQGRGLRRRLRHRSPFSACRLFLGFSYVRRSPNILLRDVRSLVGHNAVRLEASDHCPEAQCNRAC